MSLANTLRAVLPLPAVRLLRLLTRPWTGIDDLRELVLAARIEARQAAHPNPLSRFGKKCFSQTDEDGITLEILRRLGCLHGGTFAEYGVGDGLENNTLILKALGWTGLWFGGERLAFEVPPSESRFIYCRAWITRENIVELTREHMRKLGVPELDVMSLDLDGNDLHLARRLLDEGFRPKLFIMEYNAKFPPPVKWCMPYDASHHWHQDDYLGASLASIEELFRAHGYRLVCCNAASGANAFFVRECDIGSFTDVPTDIDSLYSAPSFFVPTKHGHPASPRLTTSLFSQRGD